MVAAGSGKTHGTVNPATGEVLATVAEAGAPDVDAVVRAARRAFDEGPRGSMTPSDHWLRQQRWRRGWWRGPVGRCRAR